MSATPLHLTVPPELIDQLAERVLELAVKRGLFEPREPASPWMNTAEAAAYLRCGKQRVYDLISQDRLVPSGRDGARALFHRDDLDAWLRERAADRKAAA
jgi:excisionase family DNA binding protein